LGFADRRNFLIAQTVHSAPGRIGIDSEWTPDPRRGPQRQQHPLTLWDPRFLPQQPFCERTYPEHARHSGRDLLWSQIPAQHLADFLEDLPHRE